MCSIMGKVLGLYNNVWQDEIRKPGKDPINPSSYRPVALTSPVCKLMERRITERLTYFLESGGLMSPGQSGFRKGRGMMDPVLCLESVIRKEQEN